MCRRPDKDVYETEFEARRAVKALRRLGRSRLRHYPCGDHWHLGKPIVIRPAEEVREPVVAKPRYRNQPRSVRRA